MKTIIFYKNRDVFSRPTIYNKLNKNTMENQKKEKRYLPNGMEIIEISADRYKVLSVTEIDHVVLGMKYEKAILLSKILWSAVCILSMLLGFAFLR